MLRTAFTRAAVSGTLTGIVLSTGLYVAWNQLPSFSFGTMPLFFAITLALGFGVLFRVPAVLTRGRASQWIAPGAAVVLPLAVYGIGMLTADYGFISDEAALLPFLTLLLVYGVFVGIPSFLLLEDLRIRLKEAHMEQAGAFLVGMGIAVAVHQYFCFALDFRLLFLVQSLLLLASPLLPSVSLRVREARTLATKVSGKKMAVTPAAATAVAASSSMRSFALLFAGLLYGSWVFRAMQRLAESTLSPESSLTLLLPGMLLMAGIGYALGGLLRGKNPSIAPSVFVLALAAISIGFGEWRFTSALYAQIYLAFYASSPASLQLFEVALWSLLLPSLCLGALAALTLQGNEKSGGHWWRLETATGRAWALLLVLCIAAEGYLISPDQPAMHRLALVSAFGFAFVALVQFVSERQWLKPLAIGAVLLAALAGVLALSAPPEGNETMTAPTRFIIRQSRITAAGRCDQLQSRDYDDPFHAIMWNGVSVLTQNSRQVHRALYRLGYLPMLLHPNPQSVLLLGYGTGAAIEAAKAYAPSRIVCVDAQTALATFTDSTARREHMTSFTGGVEFHIERPAAFAARASDRFDVIISPEPFATPFKTRDLFSRAHFHSVAGLLTEGGVFAQWVPVTSVTRDDMKRIIASVASAFSDVQLWLAHADVENAMLCIAASNTPVTAARMNRAGFATLQKDPDISYRLRGIGMATWESVLADYCMDRNAALKFAGDASAPSRFSLPLQASDDPSSPDRWRRVFELFTMRTPPRHLLAAADDSLRMRAAAIFNDRLTVLRASASVAMGDDTTATRALFNANQEHPWNMEVNLALADILLRKATQFVGSGQQRQALPMLAEVIKLAPLQTAVLRLMMIASMQLGDKLTAGESIEGLKRLNPRHAGFRDNQATLRAQGGALNDALLLYENAITIDPTNEEFYCNMASAQFNAGRAWEAIRILDRATERAYYPAKAYALKGNFYLDRRRNDLAKEAYLGYLRVAMPDDPLRQNVLEALAQLNATPSKQ